MTIELTDRDRDFGYGFQAKRFGNDGTVIMELTGRYNDGVIETNNDYCDYTTETPEEEPDQDTLTEIEKEIKHQIKWL